MCLYVCVSVCRRKVCEMIASCDKYIYSGIPGRERWQASQNFAALAGVVRDAMNLPRKKIRTSLGVLSEVDNNINALTTLPWGNNVSGQEQHQHARYVRSQILV